MGTLTEVECTTEEDAFGHHHHAPTLLGSQVDDVLQLLCLDAQRVIGHHAIISHQVLASKRLHADACRVHEPSFHRRSVGPCGSWLLPFLRLQAQSECQEQA